MCDCGSSASIEFVQGDSVDRVFTLLDENDAAVDPELISAVYFTCRAAHFQCRLVYDPEQQAYLLALSYAATQAMPKGRWTYDITVVFADTKRQTATYCGPLVVLQKVNAVDYREG